MFDWPCQALNWFPLRIELTLDESNIPKTVSSERFSVGGCCDSPFLDAQVLKPNWSSLNPSAIRPTTTSSKSEQERETSKEGRKVHSYSLLKMSKLRLVLGQFSKTASCVSRYMIHESILYRPTTFSSPLLPSLRSFMHFLRQYRAFPLHHTHDQIRLPPFIGSNWIKLHPGIWSEALNHVI